MAEPTSVAAPTAPEVSPCSPSVPLAIRIYRRIVACILAATLTFTFISSTAAILLVFRTIKALPLTLFFVAGWQSFQTSTFFPISLNLFGGSIVAFLRVSAIGAALIGIAVGSVTSMLMGTAALLASSRCRKHVRDYIDRAKAKHLAKDSDRPLIIKLSWNISTTAAQMSLGMLVSQWYGNDHIDTVISNPVRSVSCSVLGLILSEALMDKWVWSKYRAQLLEQDQSPAPAEQTPISLPDAKV
ncbi:uncharacterized protein PHACADRAFT_256439 [Phanerochaete carnosa HHB-10118-sp]|uniref:Uncharacterized protein n=1 Tax=Phanerochaete carnosa (strain HHB-10118-sp) TaxID=650164 RepID=K5VVS9_PHACS|nr:uncharacterized protein PHACADRAFT_256439 [Phanerochaete carnosa HHB-10118-sp]EKM55658.1 hypothetical protein PHACADRAFT_256439 [Phanerochaete carnosa HHB-10118-sp]